MKNFIFKYMGAFLHLCKRFRLRERFRLCKSFLLREFFRLRERLRLRERFRLCKSFLLREFFRLREHLRLRERFRLCKSFLLREFFRLRERLRLRERFCLCKSFLLREFFRLRVRLRLREYFRWLRSRAFFQPMLLLAAAAANGLLALLLSADACAATVRPADLLAGYFARPLSVTLNLLPAILLAAVGVLLTNRAWVGYLLSAVPTLGGALINFYKIQLRGDPFLASDLRLARTMGGIIGRYHLSITPFVLCVLSCSLLLSGCVRLKRPLGKTVRLRGLLFCLVLLPILFEQGYLSGASYAATEQPASSRSQTDAEVFVSHGFWYSFLRSIPDALPSPPKGYNARSADALLAQYESADIPEAQKVHVVGVMLEAFCDLTDFPALAEQDGVAAVYEPLHELEARGISGNLLTNIFAGGTVDTEWGFLTGYSHHDEFTADLDTYVRYFKSQGYDTVYRHPGYGWFYDRRTINGYLGFDESMFTEDGFGELVDPELAPYRSDAVLFDFLYDELAERGVEDAPLFSFSVTYQNHGPYDTGLFDGAAVTPENSGWSADCCGILSRYLYGVGDTISELCRFTDELDTLDAPVVLVVFGDHKPWLGNEKAVYLELGIDLSPDAEDGFRNTYATPYLIWANGAAKETLNSSFTGGGGDISPCFLMEELFDCCGWDGPAFMRLAREMRKHSPLLHWRGQFLSNGALVSAEALPEDVLSFYRGYRNAEYRRESRGLESSG